jgi:hypothetical protein
MLLIRPLGLWAIPGDKLSFSDREASKLGMEPGASRR